MHIYITNGNWNNSWTLVFHSSSTRKKELDKLTPNGESWANMTSLNLVTDDAEATGLVMLLTKQAVNLTTNNIPVVFRVNILFRRQILDSPVSEKLFRRNPPTASDKEHPLVHLKLMGWLRPWQAWGPLKNAILWLWATPFLKCTWRIWEPCGEVRKNAVDLKL